MSGKLELWGFSMGFCVRRISCSDSAHKIILYLISIIYLRLTTVVLIATLFGLKN